MSETEKPPRIEAVFRFGAVADHAADLTHDLLQPTNFRAGEAERRNPQVDGSPSAGAPPAQGAGYARRAGLPFETPAFLPASILRDSEVLMSRSKLDEGSETVLRPAAPVSDCPDALDCGGRPGR